MSRRSALAGEVESLRARLEEAEETLRAIRAGEVDALVLDGAAGQQVFSLHGAEQPYRLLIERMAEGAATLSAAGVVLYANRALADMAGRPLEGLTGRTVQELAAAEDRPLLDALVTRAAAEAARAELRLETPDGRLVNVMASLGPLAAEGAALGLVVSSLAEQRRAEAERLEAVSRLAAGVAHEFNNLMCVVTLHGARLVGELSEQEPLRRRAWGILRAAERAAAITDRLLAFGRRQDLRRAPLDAAALVARLAAEGAAPGVGVETAIAPALAPLRSDPVRIEAALRELIANACAAMADGGLLRLEAGDVDLGPAWVERHPEMRAGTYVRLAVADTGHGMDEHTLAHAFEPFFSTRRGTGLGLPSVYGTVAQCGGHVEIDSQPGRGTTVRILLPREGDAR